MPTVSQDLRHATRALLKHPGYLVTAVLTLGLGIGFSTATFSVINAVLLRPLPYAHADSLLVLRERKLPQFPEFSVAPGHYLAWRDQTSAFDGIGSFGTNLVNVDAGNADPERLRADRVTANLFSVLRVAPMLGRAFTDADDQDGAPPVAMLSFSMWQRRFGGRTDAIGQTVRMDRTPVTIVGVMPPDFRFPSTDTEMWIPMAFSAQEKTRFGSHYLGAVGRLKDTVTLDRARSDVNTVAARLSATDSASLGWDVIVSPLQEYVVRNV